MPNPIQFLTYQHNVQRYFLSHADKYGGIMIPLSIATAYTSGTYGFIRALCAHDDTKQYAIDPRDALFQKRWNREKNLRDPHRRMAAVFGHPFETIGLERALEVTDFGDDAVVDQCAKRCLDYQKKFRNSTDDERKLRKYKKMLGVDALGPLREPQFLVPPYFQFDDIGDGWDVVSRRFVAASLNHRGGLPIRPVLHFSRWPTSASWSNWFDWMRGQGITNFWFYPNDFREHGSLVFELQLYRNSIRAASEAGLKPSSLFAGYYGILLSYFGLDCFGNGVGYGEWRDSGYHKGGTASTRIYMPRLHQYLDAPVAMTILNIDPEYFATNELLRSLVTRERSIAELTLEECLDHFMECRKAELEFVATNDLPTALDELRTTVGKFDIRLNPLEQERYAKPLENWITALS